MNIETSNLSGENIVLFIGLDWADAKHDLCIRQGLNGPVETSQIEHTPAALCAWTQALQERVATLGGGKVRIALEQSRGGLINFLSQYSWIELCLPNPKTVARLRDAFRPSGAKDDPDDAAILCDIARIHADQCPRWRAQSGAIRRLGRLVELRRGAVDDRTALLLKLTAELKLYFPLVLELFDRLDSELACAFIAAYPNLAKLKAVNPKTLRAFFYKLGSRSEEVIDERLKLIKAAMPLTAAPEILEIGELAAQDLVRRIRAVNESIEVYEKAIKEIMNTHADAPIFKSLPGAGPALAARLLSFFGEDRERFESAAQAQRMSGIAPITMRSGKSIQVRCRRACPKFVRQTLHEYAGSSLHYCEWARLFVQKQKEKGKSHQSAIRSLAYKWLRIIWRMWKNKETYNEQRHLDTLLKRGSTHAIQPLATEKTQQEIVNK